MVGDEEFMRDLYDLLHLFGDKWVSPIVVTLAEGPMRRVEILSTIRSYSVGQGWSGRSVVLHDSILARALKKMTAAGLLIRDEKPGGFPPKVYYSLTPQVVESLTALAPLVRWARAHREISSGPGTQSAPQWAEGDADRHSRSGRHGCGC
jgi:DNA-binding HxlR family transcriptional regulator